MENVLEFVNIVFSSIPAPINVKPTVYLRLTGALLADATLADMEKT